MLEIKNKTEFLNMQSREEDSCHYINLIIESQVILNKNFHSKDIIDPLT